MDVDHQSHDYCSTNEPAALDRGLDHTEDLCSEISRLHKQMGEMGISKFGLEQSASSNNDIRFYTR